MSKRVKTRSGLLVLGVCFCALGVVVTYGCSEKAEENPEPKLMKATFSVPMMCCTVCAMKTKTALEQYAGVEKAYANFLEKTAWARYDPNMVDPERMRRAIEALGLKDTTIESIGPYTPEPLPEPG